MSCEEIFFPAFTGADVNAIFAAVAKAIFLFSGHIVFPEEVELLGRGETAGSAIEMFGSAVFNVELALTEAA